ncbi:MAG TPA: oligosaccharide flippase family protein [Ignavibacteria bacterium]|nr:oligosaccharide flippase family protein [Ignavibacteria bacterium]
MISKIKSLSKDTLIYGTGTMVARFLNFLLVPFYTNFIPPAEYGVISNIFAYIAILNVFFSLGLESGFFRFSAFLEIGDKKENFSIPFFTVAINSLLLSSIIFFIPGLFAPIFSVTEANFDLIKYTALILFFDAIVLVPFANLRLNKKPLKFSIIKIINIVVNVLMNIILIVIFKFGIEAILISNLVASVITFIVLLPDIIPNLKLKFNRELFNEIIKFSLPYIPAGISANIIQVINRPMMIYLTDESTTGIFTANYKLGIIMMIFVTMFDFAWRPFFLNNAKDPDAKKLFSKVTTLFVVAASLICLVTSVFLNDIIMMFGESYRTGQYIVPIILMAYLFNGLYINMMPGIYFKKKTKYLPYITGAAAIANVIFNFLLIPKFNMIGAAVSTLISYVIMAVSLYFVSQKFYKINYEISKILFLIISVSIFISGFFILDMHNLFLKLLIIVIFVCLIFLVKILRIENIKQIFVLSKR